MKSIRRFLLFNLLLSITVISSLTAVGNFLLGNHDIDHHLNLQLTQTAQMLDSILSQAQHPTDLQGLQSQLNNSKLNNSTSNNISDEETSFLNSYEFIVWTKQHELILSSSHAPDFTPPTHFGFHDQTINNIPWRTYSTYNQKSDLIISIGEPLSLRDQLDRHMAWDNVLILLCTYPLLGILIWLIVGHGLNSLKNLTEAIAKRPATDFDAVNVNDVPLEIKPLIEALNKLFFRLNETFEQNKRFADDAAHELRTPLAALKIQAEVALRADDETERLTSLSKVILGADRCNHIVQQLLALSRFGPETVLSDMHIIDLSKIATEMTAQLTPFALEKNIEVALHEPHVPALIYGNDTGLCILIRNLIDNSIRYTPEDGEINIHIEQKGRHVILSVIDTGPGIPPELRSRVFERFFRVLGNKASGSGLGLAIVRQIADLHRAKVILKTPRNGKGLDAKVLFPYQSEVN